ncbi:MAG: hypothetical protein U1E70_18685 [Acetobacteraceae bacterium]
MAQTPRTTSAVRLVGAAFGILLLGALTGADALAQGMMGGGQLGQGSSIRRRNEQAEKQEQQRREQAPDTLPGAKARAPVAPASKSPTDMSPNDAMFDAINRGDIETVKDALSRGARLEARNILGMTPLELSVDLGRNDISFLLLSMRGDVGARGAPPAASQSGPQKAAAADRAVPAARQRAAARGATVPATVASRPVSTPKLFANDGGAPVPNAGFLGFDSRSSSTN